MHNKNIYNTIVYPYTREFAPFVAPWTSELRKKINIVALVSPDGFGLNGKDAGNIDSREEMGIEVTSDFDNAIKSGDTFLVADGKYPENMRNNIIKTINVSIENKKNIICTIGLNEAELNSFKIMANQYEVDFVYIKEYKGIKPVEHSTVLPNKLYRPSASVIFVGEMMSGLNAFDNVVSLADFYTKLGYKVSTLAVPEYSKLFGFHTYSELKIYDEYKEHEKITYYNNYFKLLEELENPDIIIIQLFGGMVKFNDIIKNEYGIYSYIMSQSITPDCFVLCIPFIGIDKDKLSDLNSLIKYRFGYDIDCIHQSNAMLDSDAVNYLYKVDWSYLEMDRINDCVKKLNSYNNNDHPIFNGLTYIGRDNISELTFRILQDYGDAITL